MLAAPRRRNSLLSGLGAWGGGRLLSLLVLFGSAYGLWSVWSSSTWHVQWVEVSGCQLLSAERLVEQSGLAEAWSVALAPREVERNLASLPGVASASISVELPNRVRLAIEEERPVAVFRAGESEYWVSAKGQAIEPFGDVSGLPALKLVEGEWPGGLVPERTVLGLLSMVAAFPGQQEFPYAMGNGFVIESEAGYLVYLGEAEDLAAKLSLLEQLRREFAAKGTTPQIVDLRTLAGAYYR